MKKIEHFEHIFKHFKILEEYEDNELVKSEAYTLDGTKITDLPNFHAIDFVSDDISIICVDSPKEMITYILTQKDIVQLKTPKNDETELFNADKAYKLLDEFTIAINKNNLWYLYDLENKYIISEGFSDITTNKTGYSGFYDIYILGQKICVVAYLDDNGKILNNTLYIPELDMQIPFLENIDESINAKIKEITKKVKKIQKVQEKSAYIKHQENAYLTRQNKKDR